MKATRCESLRLSWLREKAIVACEQPSECSQEKRAPSAKIHSASRQSPAGGFSERANVTSRCERVSPAQCVSHERIHSRIP